MSKKNRGNFFAIGKLQWNAALAILGLNPAVSFVVMARGTGCRQRHHGMEYERSRDIRRYHVAARA